MRVLGAYKCGCSYGPIDLKDRLEYCAVHGQDIQNEYDVSFMNPDKMKSAKEYERKHKKDKRKDKE